MPPDTAPSPTSIAVETRLLDELPSGAILPSRDALVALAGKTSVRVLFYSRRSEFFDFSDLVDHANPVVADIVGFADEASLRACTMTFDLAIVCNSIFHEHLAHLIIRARNLAPLIAAWTYDNHHSDRANLTMTMFSDVVLPGHAFAADLFQCAHRPLGRSFPLVTGQWTRRFAADHLALGERSDALFGGYVAWPHGRRTAILRDVMEIVPNHNIHLLHPHDRDLYFRRSASERFDEWSAFKVHLALPLMNDLSLRLFDSLLCGQIPLVGRDCADLDGVIPPDVQDSLPVITFEGDSAEAIEAAWRRALQHFDADGAEGVMRRHRYAAEHHHIAVRIGQIAAYLIDVANGGGRTTLRISENAVSLTVDDP